MRPFTNRLVLAAAVLLFGIGGYAGAAGAESALKPSPDAALYAYGYHQRPYPLEPGPHLFVDWRYVNPGHVSYTYRGKRIQRDRPEEYGPEINSQVEVHPRDVPTGIRIEVQPAGKLGPVIRNDQPWEFLHALRHPDSPRREVPSFLQHHDLPARAELGRLHGLLRRVRRRLELPQTAAGTGGVPG